MSLICKLDLSLFKQLSLLFTLLLSLPLSLFSHGVYYRNPGYWKTLAIAFRLKEVGELSLASLYTGSLKLAVQFEGNSPSYSICKINFPRTLIGQLERPSNRVVSYDKI